MLFWRKTLTIIYAILSFLNHFEEDISQTTSQVSSLLSKSVGRRSRFSTNAGDRSLLLKTVRPYPDVFLRSFHKSQCAASYQIDNFYQKAKMGEPFGPAEKCQQLINSNKVMIFSKTTCPFCTRVKELFKALGETPKVYELDVESDGAQMQQYLLEITNQRTVPNVFVRGKHIGGCDDTTRSLNQGSLLYLLKDKKPLSIQSKVNDIIEHSPVVIFSKSTCPYCSQVKKLFNSLGVTSKIYELDLESDGPQIQEYLFEKTNQRTVPNVFVKTKHIGGCDDTMKAFGNGSLQALLTSPKVVSIKEKVHDFIHRNNVMIFSKTTCPYCVKVKKLFESLGVSPRVYELDLEEDGERVQEHLFELSNQTTVPNIFVRGKHIGGCDSTMKAFSDGSLQALLAAQNQPSPESKINELVSNNSVVIFSKTTCPYSLKVKELFTSLGVIPKVYEVDQEGDGEQVNRRLMELTQQKPLPVVFVKGVLVGGCDDTLQSHGSGKLLSMLQGEESNTIESDTYDYDLVVVGGGSGGLAAAKEAATLGQKVALCDFVTPSPKGTTWGLGGTCVNVGCIPKKLMHQASIHSENLNDSVSFGWNTPHKDSRQHSWETMVENVQNYIKSLNFGYRKELNKRKVKYINAYAQFLDAHRVKLTKKNGETEEITGKEFIIAVGGRPSYPEIPGARELCITSDDIFSLPQNPGKTLVIGASYIALECGGFLRGLHYDVTVMVRSILLRGFDQQMANLIGENMQRMGVKFIKEHVPVSVAKDELGKLKVVARSKNGEETILSGFDTVVLAIGREACTSNIGLENIPIKLNPKNKKIIVDEFERSSVPNIFAIGDVIDGKPELTPVAIHAGRYLAQRLAGLHKNITNYKQVPTTVFTPLEYGCVGLSEEEAVEIFGQNNVIVYHNAFKPLEHSLSRDEAEGYAKLVCLKGLGELVVGFHVLSPNAGEITQGFAIGLKLGAKKRDFDDLIGIHPTCAEVFTTLTTVKNPGDKPPETSGC